MAKQTGVGVAFPFWVSFRACYWVDSLTGYGCWQIYWRLLVVLGML